MVTPINPAGSSHNVNAPNPASFSQMQKQIPNLLTLLSQFPQSGGNVSTPEKNGIINELQSMSHYFVVLENSHPDESFSNPSLNLFSQLLNNLQENIGESAPTALAVLS